LKTTALLVYDSEFYNISNHCFTGTEGGVALYDSIFDNSELEWDGVIPDDIDETFGVTWWSLDIYTF